MLLFTTCLHQMSRLLALTKLYYSPRHKTVLFPHKSKAICIPHRILPAIIRCSPCPDVHDKLNTSDCVGVVPNNTHDMLNDLTCNNGCHSCPFLCSDDIKISQFIDRHDRLDCFAMHSLNIVGCQLQL
jgi:hypothetical protein